MNNYWVYIILKIGNNEKIITNRYANINYEKLILNLGLLDNREFKKIDINNFEFNNFDKEGLKEIFKFKNNNFVNQFLFKIKNLIDNKSFNFKNEDLKDFIESKIDPKYFIMIYELSKDSDLKDFIDLIN